MLKQIQAIKEQFEASMVFGESEIAKGETLHSSPAAFLIAPLNPHAAAALLHFNGSSGRPAHCQIIQLQFTRPPKDWLCLQSSIDFILKAKCNEKA